MIRLWCALLTAAAMAGRVSQASGLEIGEPAGPLKLLALAGDGIVLDNYGERPATGLLFVSSRCEVTRRVIADINQLYRKHRLQDILFVGICCNPAESGDELRSFLQRSGVIFPVYRDPQGDVARHLNAGVTPELFLLDRRGIPVFHGGLQDDKARAGFDAAVAGVLAKRPLDAASHPVEGTPIDRPGMKRDIEDPYGQISFSSQLVFERIPFAPAHHCSTICQAANDDLLCLWYGGSYESADDQALFLSRKKPSEKNWSQPQVLVQNTLQPPGNGVVFRDGSDRLCIVWARMEGTRPMRRGSGWDRCRLMARTSSDHGSTWSEDRPLLEETLWCVPRNPPIALADGTLLLPVEGSLKEVEGSHFLALSRGASEWKRAGFTSGGSQPAVVERRDHSLLALLRHSRYITQIESRDAGATWSQAEPTPLKNPNAGITMTKLANGHLVLVFNDSQTSRTPLSICRSLDEGKTWEKPLNLETNPGEYSYPCIVQSNDGKIQITYTYRRYTIKHVELNEDWLVHLQRPN